MTASSIPPTYYLFSSSKPHCGKASPIQKGLIISRTGGEADLCEEGLGFGTPILQYRKDFYFPGKAEVSKEGSLRGGGFWKRFEFNLVERHQSAGGAINTFSWVKQRLYNRFYKNQIGRKLLGLLEAAGPNRRRGIIPSQSVFFNVTSKGRILVEYDVNPTSGDIIVSLDLSEIEREGLQHIYISNELGGSHFVQYVDSGGLRLSGEKIEGWDKINAEWALFYAPNKNVGFKVSIPEGIDAFRGREVIGTEIRWSGVIFMLPSHANLLKYRISIGPLTK
ncbi:MAG: hypothetical protein ACXADL_17400 [Candidatus Thorarchaeota archaeon]|jgi:hypothetical protein